MSEFRLKFGRREVAVALSVLTLGLGATACGGSSQDNPATSAVNNTNKDDSPLSDRIVYYPNGTAEIFVSGEDKGGQFGANIFEFCIGKDFYTETLQDGQGPIQGSQATAQTRNADDPRCVDGRVVAPTP